MAMTVAVAQTHLDQWIAADLAVAQGRAYTIGDRQLTRESAATIREQIAYWTRVVDTLTAQAGGSNKPAALACWNNCTT